MTRRPGSMWEWAIPFIFVGVVLLLAIPEWDEPALTGLRILAFALLGLMILKTVQRRRRSHSNDSAA